MEQTLIGHNSFGAGQTILRSNPESGYTRLANKFLQDPRLSYETKGLLAELLSRPDDWEVRAETIVKSGKAGRDKVWRMLREAEELGYAASSQARTEGGKFQKQAYVVTDDPALLIERAAHEIATLLGPVTENPGAVIPFPEKTGAATSAKSVENQGSAAAHGKPVTGQPRTEEPLTGQPCTANPQHTKERYIQTNETTLDACDARSLTRAVAIGIAAAAGSLPAAAAPPEPPAIVQPAKLSLSEMTDRMADAAGAALANPAAHAGLLTFSELQRWLSTGHDFEGDILPAIRARCARASPGSIKSWRYFQDAVADNKAARLAPMPEGRVPPNAAPVDDWKKRKEDDDFIRKMAGIQGVTTEEYRKSLADRGITL